MCSHIHVGSLSLLHQFGHGFSHLGGVAYHSDSIGFEVSDLGLGVSLTSRDDGSSVTHSSSWRGSLSSDETNNRKVPLVVSAQPVSSILFSFSSDLTNHYNTVSLGVIHETREAIYEVGSIERISADSHNSRLTKSLSSCLVNSLISESSRSRHDSNIALLMNITWHNSDFAFTWLDNSWAVRSNKSGFGLRVHN